MDTERNDEFLEELKKHLCPDRLHHSLCVAQSARELAMRYGANAQKAYTAGLLHDIMKNESDEALLHFLQDAEILSAIRWHTTGRAGMTLLDKVVFLADFISADRDYPGVERMREKAEVSMEAALFEGLQFTIQELVSEGRPVHEDSVRAYNELVCNRKG